MATSTPTRPPTRPRTPPQARRWSPVQYASLGFGVAFLLVGIAGFVPGLTTHVDRMEWLGHGSDSELLGVFQVSVLHNAAHLLLGVLGLLLARTAPTARGFLIGGGSVYAALVVLGVIVAESSRANFLPVNDADDWLHLGLAVLMLLAGGLAPGRDNGVASVAPTAGDRGASPR